MDFKKALHLIIEKNVGRDEHLALLKKPFLAACRLKSDDAN
jgi:hypothetical protein